MTTKETLSELLRQQNSRIGMLNYAIAILRRHAAFEKHGAVDLRKCMLIVAGIIEREAKKIGPYEK